MPQTNLLTTAPSVVVVNSKVNDGNTMSVPPFSADLREGIPVDVNPGGSTIADATGLVVINEILFGNADLRVDDNAPLAITVVSDDVRIEGRHTSQGTRTRSITFSGWTGGPTL